MWSIAYITCPIVPGMHAAGPYCACQFVAYCKPGPAGFPKRLLRPACKSQPLGLGTDALVRIGTRRRNVSMGHGFAARRRPLYSCDIMRLFTNTNPDPPPSRRQVCERLGFPLAARPLEDGRWAWVAGLDMVWALLGVGVRSRAWCRVLGQAHQLGLTSVLARLDLCA